MACSRCAEESRRDGLRSFWEQVSNDDKRQFATGSAALLGSAVGWGVQGLLGGLVGMFLGGCMGGMAGMTRYKDGVGAASATKSEAGTGLPR